jgi:hypothetical protein
MCPDMARCAVGDTDADIELLHGGVDNAGAVVRQGRHVLRPSNPSSELIHEFLRYLRTRGFDAAPQPVAIDPDGRERLVFIPGDVAYPPLPSWALSDEALASTARLLRRYHGAAAGFEIPPGRTFSTEMCDPDADRQAPEDLVICHNDVCIENVVFRDDEAVAFVDFDFAAPGRPLYDLSQMVKMWTPVEAPEYAAVFGRDHLDPFTRLRVAVDAYGLPPDRETRDAFLDVLGESVDRGGAFIRARVDRGEPAFIAMWEFTGGQARFDRRSEWFREHRSRFLDALC